MATRRSSSKTTKTAPVQTEINEVIETTATPAETQETKTESTQPEAAVVPIEQPAGAITTVPDEDAPIETVNIPALKIPGGLVNAKQAGQECNFVISRDGGVTNEDFGKGSIVARPIDIMLMFIPSDLDDVPVNARLRLGLVNMNGEPMEFNINCLSVNRNTDQLYVPVPARTLLGSLLEMSENEDDTKSFFDVAKFSLVNGRKTRFFNIGLAFKNIWIQGSRNGYNMGPSTADELIQAVEAIKRRWQAMKLVQHGPAIVGRDVFETATGQVIQTIDADALDAELDAAGL